MPVSSYGGSTDSLASPSLSSWAASVSAALDGSDTTVNTRITQRVLPLTAKTGNYTLTASDEVVTCNGTLTITLPTAVGLTGKQFIIRNIATTVVTIARTSSQTVDGCSGTITLAGKGSLVVVSDGANWLVVSGEYTDESVGRRIFVWSSALSSGATTGWQRAYADTGVRDVTAGLLTANGYTAVTAILVRRVNNVVTLSAYGMARASTGSGNYYSLPSGFQTTGMYHYGRTLSNNANYVSGAACWISMGTSDGGLSATWVTNDAWPSSLPGSASGSIPAA
jgi:hypothetical protein